MGEVVRILLHCILINFFGLHNHVIYKISDADFTSKCRRFFHVCRPNLLTPVLRLAHVAHLTMISAYNIYL